MVAPKRCVMAEGSSRRSPALCAVQWLVWAASGPAATAAISRYRRPVTGVRPGGRGPPRALPDVMAHPTLIGGVPGRERGMLGYTPPERSGACRDTPP